MYIKKEVKTGWYNDFQFTVHDSKYEVNSEVYVTITTNKENQWFEVNEDLTVSPIKGKNLVLGFREGSKFL